MSDSEEIGIEIKNSMRQDKKSTYTCLVFSSLFIFYLKVRLTLCETSIILYDSPHHYSIVMRSTDRHGSYY